MKSFVGLSLALAILGCGAGQVGTARPTASKKLVTKNPFPTREVIEKITSTPPRPLPQREVASTPQWTVDPSDAKESSLEKHLSLFSGGATDDAPSSPELRCIARELAKFRSEHGANPDERLERFIFSACGRTGGVAFSSSTTTVPAKMKDADLFKAWKGKLKIPAEAKGKPLGVSMIRKGDKLTIAMASASSAPITIGKADADGRVLITGTTTGSEKVVGLINRGAFGVSRCETDPSTALPQFSITCTMAEGDPWAWVQVMSQPEGHVLMHNLAYSIARRDDKPITIDTPVARNLPAETSAAILEGINRARADAGLRPLEPSVKQSAINTKIAAHFFGAELAHEGTTGDELALGMMAGWEVDGMIKNGGFFSSLLSGTKETASFLALALESPMGRLTLLDPEVRKVAIGAAALEGGPSVGAVITTYAMFEANVDHNKDRDRVLARINAERTKRGLPAAVSLGAMPGLVREAQLVAAGKREALEGLDSAMFVESRRLQRGVRGWAGLAHDLDHFVLPNELLAPGPLQIGVEITHFKPEGAAWGAYLVYIVSPGETQAPMGQVAKAQSLSDTL